MRRAARATGHATLLALLVAGAAYGVAMLVSYLVLALDVALGRMIGQHRLTARNVTFGVLMVLLWGGVIVAALGALLRQSRRSIDLARWVADTATAPSPRLAVAFERARCPNPVVEVDDSQRAYAFTYGIWRPRVVVSTGLVERTTDAELVAVLRHEGHHVRYRDPLKVLALRTVAAAFFMIPLVSAVLRRVLERAELRADRAALRACGVAPVAGALLKAVGQPAAAPGTALAAMGGPALLEARVTQLETGQRPRLLAGVPPAVVARSVPGLALLAVYGVLLYQVCIAVQVCCMS